MTFEVEFNITVADLDDKELELAVLAEWSEDEDIKVISIVDEVTGVEIPFNSLDSIAQEAITFKAEDLGAEQLEDRIADADSEPGSIDVDPNELE